MTLKKFFLLNQAYKDDFDAEMMMKNKHVPYSGLEREVTISDVIPH